MENDDCGKNENDPQLCSTGEDAITETETDDTAALIAAADDDIDIDDDDDDHDSATKKFRPDWDIFSTDISLQATRLAVFVLHASSLYGIIHSCLFSKETIDIRTVIWTMFLAFISLVGVCAGAHRLWSHRAYKAALPMRIILATFYTIAAQSSIEYWARAHRVHHAFTDTDADPVNSKRGIFFSHMGWMLTPPHPKAEKKMNECDLRDIQLDSVAKFQTKYYNILIFFLAYLIPVWVPYLLWNEKLLTCHLICGALRHTYSLHGLFVINSLGHAWGMKPYDQYHSSMDNGLLSLYTTGEGWHNYHHAFPFDYRNAELGNYSINASTAFIDLCAKLGLASNLKTASPDLVTKRIAKTGNTKYHHRQTLVEELKYYSFGND